MSVFRFKYFQINQEHSPLKVGNDAMLLGATATFNNASRVLDLGCGTGVLCLMIAQRHLKTIMDGIELNADACIDAKKNFENAPFDNLGQVYLEDVNQWESTMLYDGIICNPPYYETHQHGQSEGQNLAKHVGGLPPNILAQRMQELTTKEGEVWMIWPSENADACRKAFNQQGWHLSEEVQVFGKPGRLKRVIWKWTKLPVSSVRQHDFTVRNNEGAFTDQYRALTKEYHDRPI